MSVFFTGNKVRFLSVDVSGHLVTGVKVYSADSNCEAVSIPSHIGLV